jgi:SAM-dependent methyltransferase
MTDIQARRPGWAAIVQLDQNWEWQDLQLVEKNANYLSYEGPKQNGPLARFIVSHVHGRQNRSKVVRRVIDNAVKSLLPGQFGLNFGAGHVRLATNVLNLDIERNQNTDVVSAGGLQTPFRDSSLSLVISQEVLEHVRQPQSAILEFHRILEPDGQLVLQLPFIIGYHPGPEDLWRFSVEAYRQLLPEAQWTITTTQISVGHGTGFHRIFTEFLAVHFSVFGNRAYRLAKGLFSVVLLPLVMFDGLTEHLPEKHRIPGGYIVTAKPRK